MKNIFNQHNNIRIAWKYEHKLTRYLPNIKDKEPLMNSTNNIYFLPCRDCDKVYIGESRQNLRKRMQQHDYNITKKLDKTALDHHCSDNDHKANFDEVKSLGREAITYKRKIKENISNTTT